MQPLEPNDRPRSSRDRVMDASARRRVAALVTISVLVGTILVGAFDPTAGPVVRSSAATARSRCAERRLREAVWPSAAP